MAFEFTVISTYGIFVSAVRWHSVTLGSGVGAPDADKTPRVPAASAAKVALISARIAYLRPRFGSKRPTTSLLLRLSDS